MSGRARDPRSFDPAAIFGTCGKKRYPHRRAADEAMRAQIAYASLRGESLKLRVYECPRPHCGGWHLTSSRNG